MTQVIRTLRIYWKDEGKGDFIHYSPTLRLFSKLDTKKQMIEGVTVVQPVEQHAVQ